MNVLLVDPPSTSGKVVETEGRNKLPTPHMGLIYLGTYLKHRSKHVQEVKVLDPQVFGFSPENLRELLSRFQPALIGITAKTFNIIGAFTFSEWVKSMLPSAKVVLGGAHGTAIPEKTLAECKDIDAVVLREGEETLREIAENLAKNNQRNDEIFQGVSGCVWRGDDGEVHREEERELIADLDSMPFPDLSLVPYHKYSKVYNPEKHAFQHVFPIFGSRGCPFNCTFCMPLLTRKHRVRSVGNIMEEIGRIQKEYNVHRIYFEDSLFCTSKEWFEKFCDSYMSRGFHKSIQWGFETRIDTIDDQMFILAKKAGCIYTFFGVESGSPTVLKKANKKYNRDDIFGRVSGAKSAGINQVAVSIILGLPYENSNTIEETIDLLKKLPYDQASINILDVYPGTEVADMIANGTGGLRWVNGKAPGWDDIARSRVNVEVNDLSAKDLIATRERALAIIKNKSSVSTSERIIKMAVYSKELLKEDPSQFFRYAKDVLKGRR